MTILHTSNRKLILVPARRDIPPHAIVVYKHAVPASPHADHHHAMRIFIVIVGLCLFGGVFGALSEQEKNDLLAAHNYYRSIVSPIATDMLKMVCFNLASL